MPTKLPQSAKTIFPIVKEVVTGKQKLVPDQFNGTGAPGDALQFWCQVDRNNNDSPDLKDWELKFHGGTSLITLFHKDPAPVGILDRVVETFGWQNKHGNISFRHTIRGKSKRGFTIHNKGNKISVIHDLNKEHIPQWTHNVLYNAIGAKLRRLILVQGSYDRHTKKVVYSKATAFWDFKMDEAFKWMQEGLIQIDFDARTKEGRGTALRNHGTKFRIKVKNFPELYEHSQEIV